MLGDRYLAFDHPINRLLRALEDIAERRRQERRSRRLQRETRRRQEEEEAEEKEKEEEMMGPAARVNTIEGINMRNKIQALKKLKEGAARHFNRKRQVEEQVSDNLPYTYRLYSTD